jgi:hypothetical protein
MARDLRDLGFRRVEDLAGADPAAMYEALCKLRSAPMDRCVLYVFRCATYFASEREHDPELLQWWNWKDRTAATERLGGTGAARRRPGEGLQ